ncbi:hypothetical protein [Ponticaulis profundi]|uniref:Uncharacterized protein n=1 Tax=Ponticaulis profundi TaxID=2665222 RepID=A0ABW1S8S0_9PROT
MTDEAEAEKRFQLLIGQNAVLKHVLVAVIVHIMKNEGLGEQDQFWNALMNPDVRPPKDSGPMDVDVLQSFLRFTQAEVADLRQRVESASIHLE